MTRGPKRLPKCAPRAKTEVDALQTAIRLTLFFMQSAIVELLPTLTYAAGSFKHQVHVNRSYDWAI